jgi:DNA-binding NarL/FixJ family response regulator
VVVLDVNLPGMNGVALAQRLLRLAPTARLLALSMHDEPAVVRAMMAAGAAGYLVKSDPLAEILRAIATVASGGQAMSSTLGADAAAPGAGIGASARPGGGNGNGNGPRRRHADA